MNDAPHVPLHAIQEWMQRLILDRADPAADQVDERLCPSRQMTAAERLAVYQDAYAARLLECLQGEFPILAGTLGEAAFASLAWAYLQRHPSQSYTLGELGARFSEFLESSRPHDVAATNPHEVPNRGAASHWSTFLVELARLEWEIAAVFDGPGSEGQPGLDRASLAAIPPDRWGGLRFCFCPSLRCRVFRHPVVDFHRAARSRPDGAPWPDWPTPPGPECVVLQRVDYRVRCLVVARRPFALLQLLHAGQTLGDAWQQFLLADPTPPAAEELQSWFAAWGAAGWVLAVRA